MGKPKPGFYIAIFAVIAGLVGLAVWRFSAKSGKSEESGQVTKDIALPDKGKKDQAEAADPNVITTVKEYQYVAAEKLPEVKGTSAYKKLDGKNTVKFAINVWAGWAPIIYANGGMKPGKVWTTPGGKKFQVELVLIDDPVAMRDAFAAGEAHIGWATVDMLPLLMPGLWKDSRTRPRVFQQIDWSNGGDGIVARNSIKTVKDLKGKTIVLAQNSPSHYFVLNALLNADVQPKDVTFKFTKDAFQAARAYVSDKSISAAVSWAPDIYNISEKDKGSKLLVSTGTANKLIGDVWFARADFSKDNPDIIEGLVRGIFDGMVELEGNEPNQTRAAELMGKGYGLPAEEAKGMLADAHWTNYAENREFFLNANNPTNFQRTYETAVFLYKQIGAVDTEIPFDKIMDFSVIKKLSKVAKYADQKDNYTVTFTPQSASSIQAESTEIFTKTVVIRFFPNSFDMEKKVIRDGKEVLYDANAPRVIKEIGTIAGQYGAARIVVEGHTDSSMKGKVGAELVEQLSKARASAVMNSVLKKFKTLQKNQFATKGLGWARPADPKQPKNQALNRRVEVKVYPLEAPE